MQPQGSVQSSTKIKRKVPNFAIFLFVPILQLVGPLADYFRFFPFLSWLSTVAELWGRFWNLFGRLIDGSTIFEVGILLPAIPLFFLLRRRSWGFFALGVFLVLAQLFVIGVLLAAVAAGIAGM